MTLPDDPICECPIKMHIEWFGGKQVFVLDEPIPPLGSACERCGLPVLVALHDPNPLDWTNHNGPFTC
jgi:hypothetical protein